MDFREVARRVIVERPNADLDEVTALVIASARTRRALVALAYGPIRNRVVDVRREIVRQAESATFGHTASETRTRTADVADPLADRRALLSEQVYVNHDVGYVPWGMMTVEHHMARVAYLEVKIHGLAVTADRHRLAAKLIEEAGASCLDEIDDIPDELWDAA